MIDILLSIYFSNFLPYQNIIFSILTFVVNQFVLSTDILGTHTANIYGRTQIRDVIFMSNQRAYSRESQNCYNRYTVVTRQCSSSVETSS